MEENRKNLGNQGGKQGSSSQGKETNRGVGGTKKDDLQKDVSTKGNQGSDRRLQENEDLNDLETDKDQDRKQTDRGNQLRR